MYENRGGEWSMFEQGEKESVCANMELRRVCANRVKQ